ncbi:hypothetical protein LTR50_002568 [Elasticomyces elasticus]|nr:hypothetical protein LTR50_002568 [Elasticomyces elasticus]
MELGPPRDEPVAAGPHATPATVVPAPKPNPSAKHASKASSSTKLSTEEQLSLSGAVTSSTFMGPSHYRFEDLAAELRVKVYKCLLGFELPIRLPRNKIEDTGRTDLSILRLSKLIHHEAIAGLYEVNTIRQDVGVFVWTFVIGPGLGNSVLAPRFDLIKSLEILTPDKRRSTWSFEKRGLFQDVVSKLPQLKRLVFQCEDLFDGPYTVRQFVRECQIAEDVTCIDIGVFRLAAPLQAVHFQYTVLTKAWPYALERLSKPPNGQRMDAEQWTPRRRNELHDPLYAASIFHLATLFYEQMGGQILKQFQEDPYFLVMPGGSYYYIFDAWGIRDTLARRGLFPPPSSPDLINMRTIHESGDAKLMEWLTELMARTYTFSGISREFYY